MNTQNIYRSLFVVLVILVVASAVILAIYRKPVIAPPAPLGSIPPPQPTVGPASSTLPDFSKVQQTVVRDKDLEILLLGDSTDATKDSIIMEANRRYSDGTFTLSLRLHKLPDLQPPQFYAGWLKNKTAPAAKPIYLGKFTKAVQGDYKGDFVLGYQVKKDLRQYATVLVTLEAVDDQKAEKTVLEGIFK